MRGRPKRIESMEDLSRSRISRLRTPSRLRTRGLANTMRLTWAGPRVSGSRGRVRAARCIRPAASTHPLSAADEILAAVRRVVGRQNQGRFLVPGGWCVDVDRRHGQPQVVLVIFVEVDVSGDLDRSARARGRDQTSELLRRCRGSSCGSVRTLWLARRRGRAGSGVDPRDQRGYGRSTRTSSGGCLAKRGRSGRPRR